MESTTASIKLGGNGGCGGKLHHFYGPPPNPPPAPVSSSLSSSSHLLNIKKTSHLVEWDLNEWRWDGDLFTASPPCTNLNNNNNTSSSDNCRHFLLPSPVNPVVVVGSSNNNAPPKPPSSSFNIAAMSLETDTDKRSKSRGGFDVDSAAGSSLNNHLKLGEHGHQLVYPITTTTTPDGDLLVDQCCGGDHYDDVVNTGKKKTKLTAPYSRTAACQVEDCKADLTNAKDYHRRHKVCHLHSKANRALVSNVLQRFCQQCSRFHLLQEFDQGKRSCRRRLAGHNKRRRKTHPENVLSSAPTILSDDQDTSNYLLITLLRILSNIHSANSSDQTKDQDLLSHLLRNLGNLAAGTTNERNSPGMLPVSQDSQNVGTSLVTDVKELTGTLPTYDLTQRWMLTDSAVGEATNNASTSQHASLFPIRENVSDTSAAGRRKMKSIDLNNVYDDSLDCVEDTTAAPENIGNTSSVVGPLWLYKDSQLCSPPQNRADSGSTLSHSPSTSSGESRTDRIVFKIFGKDPSDFPPSLRKQILDWLSSSPTDIESYIRPGCIILTIYLRMDKSTWDKLYCNLASSLRRLLDSSSDPFWRIGWIYTRVQHHVTFIYNGQVVLETPLPVKDHRNCGISSVKPIAVSVSEGVQFVVKGFNLCRPTSRLLCALEGKYLVQENCADMTGAADRLIEHDEIQSLGFSCCVPDIAGRGFIEIEDHGLSSSFFPFIVAEKDVCSEICTLESILENGDTTNEVRNQALDFIHELGWLFHRSRTKFRLGGKPGGEVVDLFPFNRLRWLFEFSIEHDWCAVVKKLLSILFVDETVDLGQQSSNRLAPLLDIGLLHRAVGRNCRAMVEFLLKYRPSGVLGKHAQLEEGQYLFSPDAMGPGGLTPLHIAATLDSSENVLDALTEDPQSVGVFTWKNARDSSGLTPHDYACLRGHYSYIHIVQRKLNKKSGNVVVVDIPPGVGTAVLEMKQKTINGSRLGAASKTEKKMSCSQCEQKMGYYYGSSFKASVRIYRPTMLSMVAIAVVCVCTALLFKSSPEVLCSVNPFRWELLEYGSQ